MRKIGKKKIIVGVVATAVIAAGAGTALAYWTTSGSGSGSGTAASSNGTLTLHANFASDSLYPGGSVPVSYTADNAGATNLYLSTLTVDSITTNVAGCLPADFHATAVATPTQVDAHATATAVGSGTLSMDNTAVSQDLCKGAIVTINVSST